MKLPRFGALPDNVLKRFRIQSILIAVVWGIVAGIRTSGPDTSIGAVSVTAFLWIVAVGFVVVCLLVHLELLRRKAAQ